jgi:type IV secretory pathway TraG/TraD family ATPase VirD4
LRPEEILTLSNDCVIVLQRGMDPILAQRVKWYQDRDFNPAVRRSRKKLSKRHKWNLLMLAMLLGMILWAWLTA